MSEKTDENIAQDVQTGDIESFRFLMERYEPKIARYVRRFLLTGEDGKDVVQEVFIKAYMNIQSFDTQRSFSSWVYRIAHNECINTIKKKNRERVSVFDLDIFLPHLVARETPVKDFERQELQTVLTRSLADLDVKYREPMILYFDEGLSYQEIADILKIPISTVGVRLQRGKAVVQKSIRKHDPSYE